MIQKMLTQWTMAAKSQHNKHKKLYTSWQTLKARATQGGISEEELIQYVTETFKVSKPSELKQEHYQQAFNWVNVKRYPQR